MEGKVSPVAFPFAVKVECEVMVAKGHNYGGFCRKCDKVHVTYDRHGKKNPMYGKHHSEETKLKIHEAKKGIPVNKGKHYNITEEDRQARRERIKLLHTPEIHAKIGKANKGKPSLKKGLTLVEYYGIEKAKQIITKLKMTILRKELIKVRSFYNLSESEVFVPSSLKDHKFSREVLIEKTKFYSYYEHNGLREHAYYYNKNGKLKVIQGLFMRGEDTESLLIQFQR